MPTDTIPRQQSLLHTAAGRAIAVARDRSGILLETESATPGTAGPR
ncbi:hypothetical protein P3T35_006353 [Kitasatospora sp. GP30]|nr:hypothetical protein [Kitasatospora sp. GP30]